MTRSGAGAPTRTGPAIVTSLVWIDARKAIVLHWEGTSATVQRLESDVPGHHHSTGHVRRDPSAGSGGAGPPRAAGESHRLEHLARFVEEVASAVASTGDVLVVGPGTVHEHLVERLRAWDAGRDGARSIGSEASGPQTERQLVARLRSLAGSPPRRRIRSSPPRMATRIRRASGALGRAAGRALERDARQRPDLGPAGEALDDEPIEEERIREGAPDEGLA